MIFTFIGLIRCLQTQLGFFQRLSGEGLPVLGDERIERRRLASADLRDHVVGAREDAVLEIDYSLAQMLDEEGIPCATLGLLRELAVHGPGVMLDGRLLAARGHNLKPRLKAHLLVPDVLAEHPAQDLRDFLVVNSTGPYSA